MQHHPVAAAVAATVAHRDPQQLAAALTETVRLRALLPGGLVESHGRADVAACCRALVRDFDTVEVLESAGEDVADRLLIHYRLGVSQGTTRWVCTQTAVCKVVDGRLAVINLLCSGFREVDHDDRPPRALIPALDSWGDFDRDDPFPLFAAVRSAAPVHEVTLADGHPAWLVVGHEEARAALNDPRLSKDMHAALARSGEVVAEGLPGPALARHMLAVDPPDHTRLRRLAMPAFSRRRVDGLEARIRSIVDQLIDHLAVRGGTDRPVDLVAGYAFPLPFTVISELLGIPEPDRADLRTLGSGSCPAIWSTTHRPSRCWSSRSTPTCASSSTAGGTRHRSDGSGQSWLRPTSPHPASPSTRGPGLDRQLRDQTQPHDRT